MQTRKDLLQAHRLMTQRAAQALILGEPDDPELPMRRLNVATFCGVMVGLLLMAAFGIYGVLRPGGATGLRTAGMLIIEKETGARYVWCQNGQLCQVANYASARLLAGTDDAHRKTVSRESLTSFQRGPLIGIPGAPNTLPDAGQLVKTPWSVCVRAADNGVTGRTSMVALVAGQKVGGSSIRDDQAVVVQADGQSWLLWKNRRWRLPAYEVGNLTTNASQVAGKWLNALPSGPDFQSPDIPGRGQTVANGPSGPAKVGQIFQANVVSGTASYVLLSDGLAPISPLERDLLLADPQSKGAYDGKPVQPIQLDAATVNATSKSATKVTNPDLQGNPPTVVPYSDSTPLCAVYDDPSGASAGRMTMGGSLLATPGSIAASGADQIVFPPGGAALAGVLPGPGRASEVSTYYLVVEGRRYALKSKDVATKLGYNVASDAVPVPHGVLELIPIGPVLDPDTAANPVPSS